MKTIAFNQSILAIALLNTSSGLRYQLTFAPSAAILRINKEVGQFVNEDTQEPLEAFRRSPDGKSYTRLENVGLIERMAESLSLSVEDFVTGITACTYSTNFEVAAKGDTTEDREGNEITFKVTHVRTTSTVIKGQRALIKAFGKAVENALTAQLVGNAGFAAQIDNMVGSLSLGGSSLSVAQPVAEVDNGAAPEPPQDNGAAPEPSQDNGEPVVDESVVETPETPTKETKAAAKKKTTA